jgi:hypothetical protein
MKRGLFIVCLVFAVTLALVFGIRVSPDALAVIVGVVLGILASVPTTALFTFLLLRSRDEKVGANLAQFHQQPPVVVINSGDTPNISRPQSMTLPPAIAPQGRKWTVIGNESDD